MSSVGTSCLAGCRWDMAIARAALQPLAACLGTMLVATSASAMIAVDVFREKLREAAHTAAGCEGSVPGRYAVRLTLGDGPARAELTSDPGVGEATRVCIVRAFEGATYPDARHGRIHLNYPYVVGAE